MIHGIGTDIVEVVRFDSMQARYGERLAERVLSNAELAKLPAQIHPARFIAKRFAAKEAFAKAVGTGLRHPVSLQRITIVNDELGKPSLQFDKVLDEYLARLGIAAHHLSISDEHHHVVAFVVLEKN